MATVAATQAAAAPVVALIEQWETRHREWQRVLDQRREELGKQGLRVQVGELDRITKRSALVRVELTRLRAKKCKALRR